MSDAGTRSVPFALVRLFRRHRDPVRDAAVLRCSFCSKANHVVKKIIGGPGVYICDECVWSCVDILNEDLGSSSSGKRPRSGKT